MISDYNSPPQHSLWSQTFTYLKQTGISIGGDTETTTEPQLPRVAIRSGDQHSFLLISVSSDVF